MNVRILLILLGILLLVLVVAQFPMVNAPRTSQAPANGGNNPHDVTLRDLNGQSVKFSSFRGKVVVVDVWATWCGYCVQEIPDLIAAQTQADQRKTPLQFIGIAMDIDISDVQHFVALQHFNYPILYKDDAQMLRFFGPVQGYPTKFILDKQGKIVDKIVGAVPMATLNRHLAPYLK